jgi:hypothetical protein
LNRLRAGQLQKIDAAVNQATFHRMIRLVLVTLTLSFAGCSALRPDISPEDRDFYYKGWLNPTRDLDHPAPQGHMPGMPPPQGSYKPDPLLD